MSDLGVTIIIGLNNLYMYVLYFTIFTGVESVLPGTSDLGVTIIVGF